MVVAGVTPPGPGVERPAPGAAAGSVVARVVAVVQPDNAASIRVLEKLGFRPEEAVTEPERGDQLALFALRARAA